MDNVHVAIRVRPLIQREKHAEAETQWKADTHTITQVDRRGKACRKEYVFDRVFDSSETTSDVYEEIAQPIVVEAMDGINGTIFAYGQTSSGKTYTMMGDSECPGIIPCAIQDIFDSIENTPNREFLLRVSYMELYNEGLCDLLSSEKKSLQIREIDKRVFVLDLTEEVVTEPQDVLQFLKKGEARRHFGQTDMNERSSRSHTIFRMIIESREIADRKKSIELAVKVSHLNLVDLAGSERANETKAEGTRLKEACRINQSLHQLAMVISKLSQGADFIPFRDSKLTRILQMSLGGNAKTAIICTVTPASVDQTHSTLQFASRAKTIKNKPQVNEVLSDEAMMQRQKKQIQELKRKILELEQQGELLEEKASLHEQQEQKIKLLEKMILVSGGVGIPAVMPGVESKKAKYKRRQTWCPGMGNPLPLLPISKPAMSAMPEEVSFSSVPPSSLTVSSSDGADSSSGSVSPVASVCSDDFSNTKRQEFMEDMEQLQNMEEDSFLAPLPLSPQRPKRKRRRAHVHFSMPVMLDTADAECQTEPQHQQNSSEYAVNGIAQEETAVVAEQQDEVCAMESTINQFKTHAEDLQMRILELEGIIASKQETAEAVGDLSEALQASNDHSRELEEKLLFLEEKIARLEEEKAATLHSVERQVALEEECKAFKKKNEEMEGKIQSLEEENMMVNQLSDALCLSEEKVADLESQACDADRRVASLTEDISALKAELQEQQGGMADSVHKSEVEILALRAQLEERKDALSAAAQQSELEVRHLQGTIGELEETVSTLKMDKEGQQAEETIATLRQEKATMSLEIDQQNYRNDQTCKGANDNAEKIQELEKTVQMRDEEIEVVNQLLEEQGLELETIGQSLAVQRAEAEKREQGAEARIAALSQEVDDLAKLLEEQHQEVGTLNRHLDQQRSEAESRIQGSAATIAALSQQIQDLEGKQAPVADDGLPILSDEGDKESAVTSERERERVEENVKELTGLLRARQEEIETLTTFLEEQGREAEEARCHHVARIAELTALVEEHQGQLAMTGAPQPGCSESGPELSLADELGCQDWKAKARRTESELLGSVQLCEEIMEEKTRVAQQMKQLQAECSSLKNSVQVKVEELQALQELHEFTQMEAAVIKEQEVQYQSNIQDLEKKLREQEDMLAAQHRHEMQELQKKLGSKDKVLEAQYQQDIDELLHKLREKNQKFDALQEQNAGLVQALSQQEQLAERLQEQLSDWTRSSEVREDCALKEQLVVRADEGTQTELRDGEASAKKVVDVSEEASQVTPEDLRFLGNEAASPSEMVDADKHEAAFQPEALQQRIAELKAREEALRQDCDSLSITISSRDQEIEVLNEILQDYGQEKESDTDSAAKIAAFVQRIEELEEKLQGSASNHRVVPCEADIQNSVRDQDFKAMAEENKNLSNALTQTENLCEELKAKVQDLREELQVLTESNLSLSEKLAAIQAYCGKLEEKVHVLENGEQKENSQEVHLVTEALENQLQDMVSQKAEWNRTENEMNSKIGYFEDCIKKSSQENQALLKKSQESDQVINDVTSEKEALHEEQVSFKQQLHESSIKVQELETTIALLSSRSEEAAETIKNRDDELEMLRQVLGELEQQLQTTRNDYSRSVSKIQQLERLVDVMNQRSADHELKKNEENEICRLRGILEHQEEQLRTQESQNLESLSRICHLESALAANNKKIQENSQAEEEHRDKLQRLQNCFEEQADQLRIKNEMCTELEAKLRDSERVLAAMNCKSAEWEAAKSKQEEEIQMLERELDDIGDEFSQHKNNYADLQTASRDQLARIKELEAVVMKREEELNVFRALLDERNQKALGHEDKYHEMLIKIQNLESINSNQGLATAELEEAIRRRDEELQQLYAALSNQEKEFQVCCSDLKEQLQTERDTCNTQERQKKELQELMEQMGKETTSLKHQLEEVSKKEEEFCTMQNALQEYRDKNESLKSETKSHEAQVRQLMAELENVKDSPSSSEFVKLEKEKSEMQSQLEKTGRKLQRKLTELDKLANIYETLKQTCSEVEDEFEEEKVQHQQTKARMQELEISNARLEELERQSLTVEELVKTHKRKLAEKNLRINELETDLLRGTDPLEDKIRSLRSEVRYQETKVQQYKKELEKLRNQPPEQASDIASVPPTERAPEATGGSGIIESCAIFAIKAENHKLTKALEKTKRELEHKDLKYHDQVSKKTEAEQEVRYWKEKARSLASHLKRAPPSHPTDAVTASPLKKRDTNDPTSHQPLPKKFKTNDQAGTKYIEKISGLHRAPTAGAPSRQRDDRNWLSKAVAERDAAAEAGKGEDDPQQCATQ